MARERLEPKLLQRLKYDTKDLAKIALESRHDNRYTQELQSIVESLDVLVDELGEGR